MQLDLQVGVKLVGGEGAGIAGGHQPAVLLGPLGDFFGRDLVFGFADLPHDLALQPKGGGDAAFHRIDILAQRAFALDFVDRHAAVDRLASSSHGRWRW